MKFIDTPLAGVYLVEPELIVDDRGSFSRLWCVAEMASHGLDHRIAQISTSFNRQRGTLRGLHYQVAPDAEAKLVRCTAGSIHDVVVDLREGSPTRYRWYGVELSAANRSAIYIPQGVGHGFQTLVDATEVEYMISVPYAPASSRGIRWDDPVIGIRWPLAVSCISRRDAAFASLDPNAPGSAA